MILRTLRSFALLPLAALLAGCAMTSSTLPGANPDAGAPGSVNGIVHGGPSPVVGATVTLWVTSGLGYVNLTSTPQVKPTAVTTATTQSDGSFSLTLPTNVVACPSGQFAYLTASGGSGGTGTNNGILLMTPIGACSSNYTNSGTTTITNTYNGNPIWMDELTTAVSAYALAGFMTVSGTNVYIDAPANNMSTSTQSSTAPSAAGLSHAFMNALNMMNISTGQPNATYANRNGGGIIPTAQIFSLGNILQACVNSTGPKTPASNTATGNDGTACGMLYSLTTPPYSGAAVPTNTMAAMLNLVKFPAPQGTTWSNDCTSSTGGTNTAIACIYNISPPTAGPYANALASAPPDWALAVVYQGGYGSNTAIAPACAVTGTSGAGLPCSGLNYPYYVVADYADNIYIANQDTSVGTTQNIMGFTYDGTLLFASAQDTTNTQIKMLGTDLAGHVMGLNNAASGGSPALNNLRVFSTGTYTGGGTAGSLVASVAAGTTLPLALAVDSANGVYYMNTNVSGSLRRAAYSGSAATPTYTVSTFTPQDSSVNGGTLQLSLDAASNVWVQEASTGNKFYVNYAANTGTVASPAFGTAFKTLQLAGSQVSTGCEGIVADNQGNAYLMTGNVTTTNPTGGVVKATYTGSAITAGSVVPLPLTATNLYSHFAYLDGAGNLISPDNANGNTVTGISVYDIADGGIALGTWKGCLVGSNKQCGTGATTAPLESPRAAAIDSAGTVWVVAGASHTLVEFIGAAAPTWPALANQKFGKPQ